MEGKAGTREAERLDVRFAAFSASSLALISECGTESMRRVNSINAGSKVPVSILADGSGNVGIHAPRMERNADVRSKSIPCGNESANTAARV